MPEKVLSFVPISLLVLKIDLTWYDLFRAFNSTVSEKFIRINSRLKQYIGELNRFNS